MEVAVAGGHNLLMLSTYCLLLVKAKPLLYSYLKLILTTPAVKKGRVKG